MNEFGRALLSVSLVCAISASAGADEFAYCTVCHGAQGNGNVVIGAPKIAGLDTDYLARQLRAFRSGWRGTAEADRSGREMQFVAAAIPDDATLARAIEFVATFEAKPTASTVKGNARRGAKHYAACAACHGERGEGNAALRAPALAPQSDWYLAAQLEGYRAGWRGTAPEDELGMQMRAFAAALPDDAAIADVVAYINSLREERP
jgi:cytochrome c oxidase subunit 2